MSDFNDLKVLALAAEGAVSRDMHTAHEHWQAFRNEAMPRTILDMIAENDRLKAEIDGLRKRIEDLSSLKDDSLSWRYIKCLACGGYHHYRSGLPCPNMQATASAAMGQGRMSDES